MNKQDALGFFTIAISLAFGFTMVILSFVAKEKDNLKQEAVNRGFAEWKVIGENRTEFVWREKQ